MTLLENFSLVKKEKKKKKENNDMPDQPLVFIFLDILLSQNKKICTST